MVIKAIFPNDELWNKAIDYGKNCSWKAGAFFAKQLEENKFTEWERVFVVVDNDKNTKIGLDNFTKERNLYGNKSDFPN